MAQLVAATADTDATDGNKRGFTVDLVIHSPIGLAMRRVVKIEVSEDELRCQATDVLGKHIEMSDNCRVPVVRRFGTHEKHDLRKYLKEPFTMNDFARRFAFQISWMRASDWENRERN
jgi:hypothetical protein